MPASFALFSLLAILLGAVTMAAQDVPASRWIVNVAGWALGAAMALGLARMRMTPQRLRITAALAACAVIASLAGPDQAGVHRWIGLGPLTINTAALGLAAAIAAVSRLDTMGPLGWASLAAIALALVAQPDASQSAAFSVGIIVALTAGRTWRAAIVVVLLASLSVATFLRPDPLLPVPEVEQIITLAWQVSPLLATAMVASLVGSAASFLLAPSGKRAAWAVFAYAAVVMLAPLWGWFPVPLAGSGMSFPIGLWLGVAVLAAPMASVGSDGQSGPQANRSRMQR